MAKATFDIESREGKIRMFNAKNGSSISMKDLDNGTVLNAIGVLQYMDTVDTYGKPQEVTITTIFTSDGNSYASVSDSVAKAGSNLIDLVNDLGLEEYTVRVIKETSKGGNEYLNLQLAF